MSPIPSTLKRPLSICLILFALAIGCSAKQPVLYPNEHLKATGDDAAQEEIAACMALARESGAEADKGEETVKKAAGAAVVGAALVALALATGLLWLLYRLVRWFIGRPQSRSPPP